jgi:hypothetical protein
MSDFEVFPDSEYLAVQVLKAEEGSGKLFGNPGPRIGTKLPTEPDWTKGVIQVQRVGGIPTERRRLDHANIQVDVWHENKADAHDIAQIARAVLHRGEGKKYSTPAAVLTGVEDALGMHWQFDQINLKPRYTFAVYFTVHR